MPKITNFDSLGLYSHISAAINVKLGMGSGPCTGRKPIFGPLCKLNSGMAALRAGLPVIK